MRLVFRIRVEVLRDSGLGVWGLGYEGSGFIVEGFRLCDQASGPQDYAGCGVWILGVWVAGLGFKLQMEEGLAQTESSNSKSVQTHGRTFA